MTACFETIAAFCGGRHEPLGLQPAWDGFELWLMQTLLKDFGKGAAGQISLAFHELEKPPEAAPGGGDVCVVTVKSSPRPRLVVENGQELFFIRTSNATNQLKPSELVAYCAQHWPEPIAAT